jgi:hypothetical protein
MNFSISLLNSINPLFFAVLAVVAILIAKAVYTYKNYSDLRGKAVRELFWGSLVTILMLGVFIVLPLISGLTIRDNNLDLRLASGFTFKTIPKEDLTAAKVIDLDQSPYAIQSKIVGTRIRNYREGLFTLANGNEGKVFVNGNTVLLVETKNDGTLLLRPDNFDTFVETFSEKLLPVEPQ